MEEEIVKSELAGKQIVLSFDANSTLGPDWIPDDPHSQSPNGKILSGIMERHALFVANGVKEKCTGVITRKRSTIEGLEVSAIDFVILSHEMVNNLVSLNIDEVKKFSLTSLTKTKKGTEIKESDHNTLITKFTFNYNKNIKKHNTEIFNFRDKNGQEKFKTLTSTTNKLSSIFRTTTDLNSAINKFMKTLKKICHQSFRKI